MKLDWTLLQTFLAVAERGSLTAAGRDLGLSQPTVGRHIRRLEALLGEVLFTRRKEGHQLTPRGTQLFEHAAAMASAARLFEGVGAGFAQHVEGTVRIASAQVFAIEVLPALLADLLDQHPRLEIEVVVNDSEENLLRREADVAIRHFRSRQQDIITSKVSHLGIGLFAHRDYLARHGVPETPRDLLAHRVIGFDRIANSVDGAKALGLDVKASDFRLRTDSIPTQNASLLAGLGIGSYQVWLAERHPELVRVIPGLVVGELEVWVAAHDDLTRSPSIRAVYDALRDGLSELLEDVE
ncbi:MAG: LysR family transcriptional regulator [Acidobacteriota bacterium]